MNSNRRFNMAVCGWCNREMTSDETVTCTGNTHVSYEDGESLPPIPFTAKPLSREEWFAMWQKAQTELVGDSRFAHLPPDTEEDAEIRYQHYAQRSDRCHDCHVKDGGNHHPGCDDDQCPRCHGQLISCGCCVVG